MEVIQVSFHIEADSATAYGQPPARAVSADEGKTWKMLPRDQAAETSVRASGVSRSPGVWPRMLTLKNGITLAVYGRPGFFIHATANPTGLRWDERVPIVSHRDTCAYGALQPLNDDTALVAYSDFNLKNAEANPAKAFKSGR